MSEGRRVVVMGSDVRLCPITGGSVIDLQASMNGLQQSAFPFRRGATRLSRHPLPVVLPAPLPRRLAATPSQPPLVY